MTTLKDARVSVATLMDALAAEVESASDRELLDDAAAAGLDANAESNRVRGLLLGAVVRAKKERLADAVKARRKNVPLASTGRIPMAPSDRRAFLMQTLEDRSQMKEALGILQHRDLAALSDADIESVLKQLKALGLLGEDDSEKP